MIAIQINDQGVAINGIDPVSCFDGETLAGSERHSIEWRGVTWRFENADNLEKFRTDPDKFTPQYGGHCSLAIQFGKAAEADPKVSLVLNGKLYFFASPMVRRLWRWFGNFQKSSRKWQDLTTEANR